MNKLFVIWNNILDLVKDFFLLLIRLYWGWGFLQAGLGKFMNWDRTLGFFEKLNLPFPTLNVFLASSTELVCGAFLIAGLFSRYITVPLIFTMLVAYLTAHAEELSKFFSDTDVFLSAPPFLFLFVSLVILFFGAGKYSLDYLRNHSK